MVLSMDVWTEDSQSLYNDGEFRAGVCGEMCVCVLSCKSVRLGV